MFKNLREFVESKIERPLFKDESININLIAKRIEVVYAVDRDAKFDVYIWESNSSYHWDFEVYEKWLKEQGKEIF